ncbi:unnamed protein product [Pseudo-nitzschia multistriata]|uniref:Cyclin-like domain-containing protein n=1 Tax=Pseudo-nitzschia multistriata TaxID=183589 RepID=A0A448YVS1_9STRA|nr:unnamed protein product [Pseudo-nitzschia multistriata]
MKMEEPRGIVTVTPPRKILRNALAIHDEIDGVECAEVSNLSLLAPPSELFQDELKAILQVESQHYKPPLNYFEFDGCRSGVNENWRRRLCEWMFEVTDHYDFDREVVSFAFDYLDRSISLAYGPTSNKNLSKKDYQLYAVTSLYLAMKVHGEMDSDVDGKRIKLRISAFQELSRGCFTTETIAAKELELLTLFKWHINPPTCARCIFSFLRLLPTWSSMEWDIPREDVVCQIFDVAKYLTELSIFVSDFSFSYSPSMISYSAILCALDYVEESIKPMPFETKIRFLVSIRQISNAFFPESEDVRKLQVMLRKLAPKMFLKLHKYHQLPRTVSLNDVDPANSVLGKTSRSISPIVLGGDEPKTKRQKV